MKKILCITMAVMTAFCLCGCSKKIVVNKKPHVEAADIVYDTSEIKVQEEFYFYCGAEYELSDLMDTLSLEYIDGVVFNVVFEEAYSNQADQLAACFEDLDMKYTLNGAEPDDETAQDGAPEIITE